MISLKLLWIEIRLVNAQVLRAIAKCKGAAVRRRFYQLRIMDLLVRELSLEYEAQLQARLAPAAARMASASSFGSQHLGSPLSRAHSRLDQDHGKALCYSLLKCQCPLTCVMRV